MAGGKASKVSGSRCMFGKDDRVALLQSAAIVFLQAPSEAMRLCPSAKLRHRIVLNTLAADRTNPVARRTALAMASKISSKQRNIRVMVIERTSDKYGRRGFSWVAVSRTFAPLDVSLPPAGGVLRGSKSSPCQNCGRRNASRCHAASAIELAHRRSSLHKLSQPRGQL